MNKILQLCMDNAKREKQVSNLVRNEAGATIYIYDIIDPYWGVSANSIIAALNQVADAPVLHIRINSPGGSVFESRAIIEAIKRFTGTTIAHIDSLAASAATSIALACNEVEISDGGFFMIHNASGMAWGDKADLRKTADLLEKVEGSIIAEYAAETGQTTEQIITWMQAETWFDAGEAIAAGFVDRLQSTAKVGNTWNLAAFAKAPAAIHAPAAAAPVNTQPEPIQEPAPVAVIELAAPPEPAIPVPCMRQANINLLALLQAT
jgi:ATP-dependent protease ClpP protease subunit